jgi:hypothetical protein
MTVPNPAAMQRVSLIRRHVLKHADGTPIPADQRWSSQLAADQYAVRRLVDAGIKAAEKRSPDLLLKIVTRLAFWGLTGSDDQWYVKEIRAVATQIGVSVYDMALIQQQYTWGHLGCTTAAFWDAGRGEMVHVRSLDWDMVAEIAGATRIVECYEKEGDTRPLYVALAIAGMVGLLTAVRPGKFSVTINYSPWKGAGYYVDPTIRLREVMDDPGIADYRAARDALSDIRRPVGAPVFYTVCGTGRDEMCVVEWSRPALIPGLSGECHVRAADHASGADLVVQANHHDPAGPYAKRNPKSMPDSVGAGQTAYDCELTVSSRARQLAMDAAIRQGLSPTGSAVPLVKAAYAVPPVWNHETVHWAIMRPAAGSMDGWARTG